MSIICNMWIRKFINTNPGATWRNTAIIHNRYAHAFSKVENDKFPQNSDTKENLKLDANPVEKASIDFQKRSHATSFKGNTQMFSTAAAQRVQKPSDPKPHPGGPPIHYEEKEEHSNPPADDKNKKK